MNGRNLIQRVLIGLGVAIIVGYSYFALGGYIRGPHIVIVSPKDGFSTTTESITILGKIIRANDLFINGAPTDVDLEGNFHSQLLLAPGYNIMKITAKDNYDRLTERTIEIVLLPPENSIFATTATTTATSSPAIIKTVPGCLYGNIYSTVTGKKCPGSTGTTSATIIN